MSIAAPSVRRWEMRRQEALYLLKSVVERLAGPVPAIVVLAKRGSSLVFVDVRKPLSELSRTYPDTQASAALPRPRPRVHQESSSVCRRRNSHGCPLRLHWEAGPARTS